jgi:hypothetical protein
MSIKTGTKLKSKATGAIVEVIDMDFNMYDWTYTLDILGMKKYYTYPALIKEYDVVSDVSSPVQFSESSCTCGGMKTYNSRDSVYHSVWCFYGK